MNKVEDHEFNSCSNSQTTTWHSSYGGCTNATTPYANALPL